MPGLRLLILSDARPGHYRLSFGIAHALARQASLEIECIDVHRGRWTSTMLAALLNGGVPPERVLTTVYHRQSDTFPRCDLIVSAGAETLAANICLARIRRVPNIFYGSIRYFRPEDLTLVLTSYPAQSTRPNHALALKPSDIDPDDLRPTGYDPARAPKSAGLLIGGNTRNFTFTSEDNQQLLAFLRNSHRHDKTEWHVTNSHNTPHDLSDALARTEVYPLGPIKEFIDVRRSGPGTVRQIIDKSDVLLCTEDSSTMISEAIQSRRPVLGLSPNHWKLPAQEQGYRRYLTERGWTRSLAIADLSPDRVAQELAKVTPMTTNALADLADLLCAQIPDLIPHEDRHPLS